MVSFVCQFSVLFRSSATLLVIQHTNNHTYIDSTTVLSDTRSYGCTPVLTFILNVLGEVLSIGILYAILFGQK